MTILRHLPAPLLAALLCVANGSVRAELPDVPDPKVWSALPADLRDERARTLRKQLRAATPGQRARFRAQLRERLLSLPPEQRREIADRLRAERRAYIQSLLADERRALLRERR